VGAGIKSAENRTGRIRRYLTIRDTACLFDRHPCNGKTAISDQERMSSANLPKKSGTELATFKWSGFGRPERLHGVGVTGVFLNTQDNLSCDGEAAMNENGNNEGHDGPIDMPSPQPVPVATPGAATATRGANKGEQGAVAETVSQQLQSRFSGSLSMKQIVECSLALAEELGRAPNKMGTTPKSKSEVRGVFERSPRSGVWWISYRDAERKRHREKIGRRAAAIDAVARRRLEVKEGRFLPPRGGRRLTFRDLAMEALAHKKNRLAPLSYAADVQRLTDLFPLIGAVPADSLTPVRIAETLDHLKASMSGSTVNRYRSAMSSVYSFGISAGKMATNPVTRVKRYRENPSRLNWLRPEQEKAVREAIDTNRHEAEFSLVLNTGMRRGENWNLVWTDVDLVHGNLTVHGKTGRRHIPANAAAKEALLLLQNISGHDEFVSPDRNAAKDVTRDFRTWFEDAVEKAGIDNFHFHDLRHTFASRLVMEGVDISTVRELMGHRNINTTQKYSHLADDHKKAAVEKMNPRTPSLHLEGTLGIAQRLKSSA
jgi:site-specific recombinase XerD